MKAPIRIIVKVNRSLAGLIPRYLENRKKDIETMKKALESKDFKSIEYIGHKMKGHSAMYSFDELGKIGILLEKFAKKNDEKKLAQTLATFETFLANVDVEYIND